MAAMLTTLAVLLAGWAGPMVDGHVHKAPHSGVIAHAGPYHIEVVITDTAMRIWLLDQKEQTVPPPAGSTIQVKADRGFRELVLRPAGERYEAPFDLQRVLATGFLGRVELRLGSEKIRSEFRWSTLDARHRLDDRASAPDRNEPSRRKPKPKPPIRKAPLRDDKAPW